MERLDGKWLERDSVTWTEDCSIDEGNCADAHLQGGFLGQKCACCWKTIEDFWDARRTNVENSMKILVEVCDCQLLNHKANFKLRKKLMEAA